MAKTKVKAEPDDHWAEYFAIQLTEEESAALREESQKEIDRMKREGLYEKLIALRGQVHLNLDVDEVRKLRKDRR